MRHIIHNLRQRPDHHKKGVALAISGGFTLILVAIWGITFPVRYPDLFGNSAEEQPAAALTASPIDSLKASLNNQGGNDGVTIDDSTTNSGAVIPASNSVTADPNSTPQTGSSLNSSRQSDVIISDAQDSFSTQSSQSPQNQSNSSVSPFTSE